MNKSKQNRNGKKNSTKMILRKRAIKIDIRSEIKQIIRQKMLSQASIAKKIGMLPNKLASILNCKRELKISDFFTLCDVLEIEPNKFYSGMKRESIFCCGKALKAITITDEENSAVAVITDGVIIEHKGYKVVLSEI